MPETGVLKQRMEKGRLIGLKSNGRVDWHRQRESAKAMELIKLGFSDDTVAYYSGLTVSQVRYRKKFMGLSNMSWRRGETREACQVINKFFLVDLESIT